MGEMRTGIRTLQEQRPRRADGCSVERQQATADAPAYILKDTSGRRYMKLTEEGVFLWQQIDGVRTIRDLCTAYMARFQRPAPAEVLRALARLLECDFITFDTAEGTAPLASRVRRSTLGKLSSLCIWYGHLDEMDGRVTALYRYLCPLYTPFAQALLLVFAVAGGVAFVWHCATNPAAPSGAVPRSSLLWIASLILHVIVHEAAHAVTCKHFGRTVYRLGVGWYYFAPVAFVDTSDMWAAARWPRVLVSAAGPYSNLVLAGIAALAALAPAGEGVRNALWTFSIVGYILAAVNMNPLLELDGYYALVDLLEIPNLRSRGLKSLGSVLRGRARAEPRHDSLILLFGAASLAYGIAMGLGLLFASGNWIATEAAAWLPQPCAQAVGWAVALTMSLLILHRFGEGLRAQDKPH